MSYLEQTVKLESADAAYRLARLYDGGEIGNTKQDENKILQYYELASKLGSGGADYDLGWVYFSGERVPQDYVLARQYFEQTMQRGIISTAYQLGQIYQYGKGVRRDLDRARQ